MLGYKPQGSCCGVFDNGGILSQRGSTAPIFSQNDVPLRRPISSAVLRATSFPEDVLSSEDLVVGTFIAVALAFTASFLQSRRAQNDFVLWQNAESQEITEGNIVETETTQVFDEESWREMSQPENYILYKRRINERERKKMERSNFGVEKAWVLIALLVLFVPIFSVEFFFALSRQLICDGSDVLSQPEWAGYLCSPANAVDPRL